MGRTTKTKDKVKLHKTIESRTDFFYYMFRNILLASLPLFIISGLVLSHLYLNSSAISSDSDSLNISISSACTLSSSTDSAHTVSVNAGSYTADIGNTKINAYCNDNNGYSIYAIGSSNNVDGNTDLISNINDNYNIHTGIYDSSSTSSYTPSSWSMKLTPGLGTGINPDTGESITVTPPTIRNNYDSYSLVPENYTLVASRPSRTDMTLDTTASGSYFTTTYDIYASSVQPPGTYSGKVKYLMVHPHSDATITNINDAFARIGKTKIYSPTLGNYYYTMQDMTSDICSLVAGNGDSASAQLIDTRDNNVYWVTKLKDGHCWMTQNLDLDIVADAQDTTKMKTLTSEDTDLTDHSLTGAYSQANGYSYDESTGITSWTPANSAKTINFTGTTVTGWQNSNTIPYSASKTDDTNTGHASLGNYYNGTAAIASNNSSNLINSTFDNISQNPQNSICPKGWRLPTISSESENTLGSTNEFARLNLLYNSGSYNSSNKLIIEPLWFIKGGLIVNSSLLYPSTTGAYQSSTIRDSSIYIFRFDTTSVKPALSDGKERGFFIRCIVK